MMSKPALVTGKKGIRVCPLPFAFLAALVSLLLPSLAWAEPPRPSPSYTGAGAEQCATCHPQETETWRTSPHAQAVTAGGSAGATCEVCHGTYVEGHPKTGMMQLNTDSSACKNCHVQIYEKWAVSTHRQANVQCIGCHLSHSQSLRLADQALCGACHQDRLGNFAHTAHGQAGVTCLNCHVSSSGAGTAPSHDFTLTSSQACVLCHGQAIHKQATTAGDRTDNLPSAIMAYQSSESAATPQPQEEVPQTLKVMPMISLGLGMGVGGVLGIILMLTVGYISNGKVKE